MSQEAEVMEPGLRLLLDSMDERQSGLEGSKSLVHGTNLNIRLKFLGLTVAERPR